MSSFLDDLHRQFIDARLLLIERLILAELMTHLLLVVEFFRQPAWFVGTVDELHQTPSDACWTDLRSSIKSAIDLIVFDRSHLFIHTSTIECDRSYWSTESSEECLAGLDAMPSPIYQWLSLATLVSRTTTERCTGQNSSAEECTS